MNRIEEVTLEYLAWFVERLSDRDYISDRIRDQLLEKAIVIFSKATKKDLKLALEVAIDVKYSRILR